MVRYQRKSNRAGVGTTRGKVRRAAQKEEKVLPTKRSRPGVAWATEQRKAQRAQASRDKYVLQKKVEKVELQLKEAMRRIADMREQIGLPSSQEPISNEELVQLFRQHALSRLKQNERQYSLLGYEKFRNLVCGAGLPMNQVSYVLEQTFDLWVGGTAGINVTRDPVRRAILALGAADDAEEKVADATRKHQLCFDESAHIMVLTSSHWNDEMMLPELTVIIACRLDKQTGQILAMKVDDSIQHIPAENIINALSDNCKAMDGKYKGAMVCLFRLLKARENGVDIAVDLSNASLSEIISSPQSCYVGTGDENMPLHVDDDTESEDDDDAVDSDDEGSFFTLQSRGDKKASGELGAALEPEIDIDVGVGCRKCRHTRSPCTTHLVSIMHDTGLICGCGKAPGYKQGMVKINHIITYLLQQHYIWSADRKSRLLVCADLGFTFDRATTEPDLNRWQYTFFATADAIDPDFAFKTTMYYMAVTTRMNCNCGFAEADGRIKYFRDVVGGKPCDCIREWLPDKTSCKEARQLLWFGCLHDPAKGADWWLSTQVRYHLLAENEFSIKVVNLFYGWTIGQESAACAQWRQLYATNPEMYPKSSAPKFRQLPPGYRMGELSRYIRKTLGECDRMQTALDANCWTTGDVIRHYKQAHMVEPADCPVITDPLEATSGRSYFSCINFDDCWAEDLNAIKFMEAPAVKYPWEIGIPLPTVTGGPVTVELSDLIEIAGSDPMEYTAGPDLYWEIQPPIPDSMCIPFEDTVSIARRSLALGDLPGGRKMYRSVLKSLRKWIKGYIKSCREWLTRLPLLPFAIGELEDPIRGPPLARALIRHCWKDEPMEVGRMLVRPLMYRQYGPLNECDSEADSIVLRSIELEAKAEYHDVYETTVGKAKVRRDAAAAAMADSISSGCIDTFSILPTIRQSPAARQQFFTFAAFGAKPALSSLICPSISQYPDLNRIMNETVRSCLISQQKIEALFNKYRLLGDKRNSDAMREAMLKWKQNNWKRVKTRAELGLIAHKFERTKADVLKHYKQHLVKLKIKSESEDVLKRLCPHIGHGAWRKTGKKKGLTKADRELLAAEMLEAEKCLGGFWELEPTAFLEKNKKEWREKAGNACSNNQPVSATTATTKKRCRSTLKFGNSKEVAIDWQHCKESQKVFTDFMTRQRHQWRASRFGCQGDEKLFCVCQQPYDDDYKPGYLGCDGCGDWFHAHCIGVSNRLFRKLNKASGSWYCNSCAP